MLTKYFCGITKITKATIWHTVELLQALISPLFNSDHDLNTSLVLNHLAISVHLASSLPLTWNLLIFFTHFHQHMTVFNIKACAEERKMLRKYRNKQIGF